MSELPVRETGTTLWPLARLLRDELQDLRVDLVFLEIDGRDFVLLREKAGDLVVADVSELRQGVAEVLARFLLLLLGMTELRQRNQLLANEKLAEAIVVGHAPSEYRLYSTHVSHLRDRRTSAAAAGFAIGGRPRARAAELRGELALATALFSEAGRTDEAARVILLRGDVEPEPAARLRHYAHALATAPLGSRVHVQARRKHAATVVAIAATGPLTRAAKEALARAAADLEAVGDPAGAAEAYAHAGDLEGQARALARAGELDALETLLTEEQRRDRATAAHRRAKGEFALLVASGQRRQAVDLGSHLGR